MDMIHCILRYLNESLEQGVVYNSHGHLNVEAFTCANWARSKYDWRSSTGYCTLVIAIIILEDNKKKKLVVAQSSSTEYLAMARRGVNYGG